MQLAWCLSLLFASSLLVHSVVLPMPTTVTTIKPKLIVSGVDEFERKQPMLYHFITDHRPSTLGQNFYIKPGQLVGTFNLDSGTLHVRHEDSNRPISSRLNILFVATPNDSIKNELNK